LCAQRESEAFITVREVYIASGILTPEVASLCMKHKRDKSMK